MSDGAILVTALARPQMDLAASVKEAARRIGVRPAAVAWDMLRAVRKPRFFGREEYFIQGAWEGTPAQRAEVISLRGNQLLNDGLRAGASHDQFALISDKYLTGLVLAANGFAVPEARAAFSPDRAFGSLPTLTNVEAFARWLSDPANLGVFAKPVEGSRSLGSVPLLPAGPGRVDLGDRVVGARDLAEEVARHYPRGWIVQELITQRPEVEARIGPGVGTVRVVTLWEADGPQILYAVWRHPPLGARVDSVLGKTPNIGCSVDLQNGEVTGAHLGDRFSGRAVTQSLVDPNLPLVGFRLPDWPRIVETCREAHRLFPGHALLGWDMAMSRRGPLISEINTNPIHLSFQRAFGKGFLTSENRVRIDHARRLLAERLARYKS